VGSEFTGAALPGQFVTMKKSARHRPDSRVIPTLISLWRATAAQPEGPSGVRLGGLGKRTEIVLSQVQPPVFCLMPATPIRKEFRMFKRETCCPGALAPASN